MIELLIALVWWWMIASLAVCLVLLITAGVLHVRDHLTPDRAIREDREVARLESWWAL